MLEKRMSCIVQGVIVDKKIITKIYVVSKKIHETNFVVSNWVFFPFFVLCVSSLFIIFWLSLQQQTRTEHTSI